MANIISHGYRVTAVRILSGIASLTTGTGKADPPHVADLLPLPRESHSHTRMVILLRACATDDTGSGTLEAQAPSYNVVFAFVLNISWHPE